MTQVIKKAAGYMGHRRLGFANWIVAGFSRAVLIPEQWRTPIDGEKYPLKTSSPASRVGKNSWPCTFSVHLGNPWRSYCRKPARGTDALTTRRHLLNPRLPFCGMGSYHGKFSFDTFSDHRSILGKPPLKMPMVCSTMAGLKKYASQVLAELQNKTLNSP